MTDTNSTTTDTNLINNKSEYLLTECSTCLVKGDISTTDIIEKTTEIENRISLLQDNINKKGDNLGDDINTKIDHTRSNKNLLQASRRAIRNHEGTQNYTLQVQKYNLQSAVTTIENLQRDVDTKQKTLVDITRKLNEKKDLYCKQANELLKLIEKISTDKKELLNTLEENVDDVTTVPTDNDCSCD